MYSLPRSLHRSMRIFHCWKQCCRLSSYSLFMSSVAFAFTAYTDSNLVPFNADLIFGNKKKSHGAGSGEYGGCCNTVILCFIKKSWQTGHCVPAHCFGEEPMSHSSTFQVFFFSPVHEGLSKPPCSRLVNGMTFRHPIHMNNPSDVEKTIIIAVNLDLLCRAFFCLGKLWLFQCMDWRLLSGSY